MDGPHGHTDQFFRVLALGRLGVLNIYSSKLGLRAQPAQAASAQHNCTRPLGGSIASRRPSASVRQLRDERVSSSGHWAACEPGNSAHSAVDHFCHTIARRTDPEISVDARVRKYWATCPRSPGTMDIDEAAHQLTALPDLHARATCRSYQGRMERRKEHRALRCPRRRRCRQRHHHPGWRSGADRLGRGPG